MLSITFMMLIPGGIIPVHAVPGGQLLTINNPTPNPNDHFGKSVATTPNGDLLVSAYISGIGAAYLFDKNDGSLLLTINNPTPNTGDYFGSSVATTYTGNLLVGAYLDDTGGTDTGTAYLFDGNDGSLLLTINNPTPDTGDRFGSSVATTPNGNLLVGAYLDDTGATNAGSAYLFDGNDGSLLLTINNPTPDTSDHFGSSVAVTPNGDWLVGATGDDTGATNAGSAYLFDGNDGSLLLTINNPTPDTSDHFGSSVATTPNGDLLVSASRDNTGATVAGSAYLFDGNDGSLLLTINNPTPETYEYFGSSIATTNNGNLLVGAYHDDTVVSAAGAAYLFDGNDGSLLLTINNPTPEVGDFFGISVATTPNGDLLVGAIRDNTGAVDTGSAYLFERISASTPAPIITSLIADDPDDLDNVYSINDTITILFDSDTNTPGGAGIQSKAAVNNLYNFTDSLGEEYTGLWSTTDTFTITIENSTGATPPIINGTTVTPAEITPILSADETSEPSAITSPVLSGDFGIIELFCGQPESYYDNIIEGTSDADYLIGTTNADLILGYAGNDFIRGMQGSDCIYAGTGNDFIQGGRGDDIIYAGDGDDVIRTGFGNDIVYGEDGNDILHAVQKTGSNILDGGNGDFDICVPQSNKVTFTTIGCEIINP